MILFQAPIESPVTLTIHGLTLSGIILILTILFRQHKVWVRMKDRLNSLWAKHCSETKELFVPLENGK